MKITRLFLAVLLFSACNPKPAAENKKAANLSVPEITQVDPHFKAFIGKFRVLQLPLTIKVTSLTGYESLPLLDGLDSIYVTSPDIGNGGGGLAYGLLPDTANSYKLIWLLPADIYVPVLTTLTKKGKIISQDYMGVGGCGVDCCFECNETVTVNKDLSIYSVDSVNQCECDDNGPKPETMSHYTRVKTAAIKDHGKFKFTDITEEILIC